MKTPEFFVRMFFAIVLAASLGMPVLPVQAQQASPSPKPCTPASQIPRYQNISDIPGLTVVGYDEQGRPIVTAPGTLVCLPTFREGPATVNPTPTPPPRMNNSFTTVGRQFLPTFSRANASTTPAPQPGGIMSLADVLKSLGLTGRGR